MRVLFLFFLFPSITTATSLQIATFTNKCVGKHGCVNMPEFDKIKTIRAKYKSFNKPIKFKISPKMIDQTKITAVLNGIILSLRTNNDLLQKKLSTKRFNETHLNTQNEHAPLSLKIKRMKNWSSCQIEGVIQYKGFNLCFLKCEYIYNKKTTSGFEYFVLRKIHSKYYQDVIPSKETNIEVNFLISSYTTGSYSIATP